MKKVLFFLFLILIVVALFSGFFWLYEAQYFKTRASISSTSFSVENSYVFVSPLKAPADGKEKIRVTVFVLNNQGLGVLGKRTVLGTDTKLNIEAVQALTDNFGKAVFDISSTQPGEYYLEIRIDETLLPQKAHLTFY